jgi:hypothetical protein
MDNRKLNKGTKGNKGGRPTKADEIKLIESMDAITAPDNVWRALYLKVEEGDVQAIKTWLSYRFGMPKQTIEQKSDVNLNNFSLKDVISFDKTK